MYLERPDSRQMIESIRTMEKKVGDVLFIMLGENAKVDVQEVISALNRDNSVFFGGVFPAIISGDQRNEEGAIITTLPSLTRPLLITGLSSGQVKFPDFMEISGALDKQYTALVFVDGLAANISLFLQGLFRSFGNSVHYVGGGAGSLTLKQQPCLFTNDGFVQDAAIVAFIKLRSSLAVRHGWEKIMGPIVATKTDKNVVIELNWENALEVYRRTVEEASGKKITSDNFFDIAKGYPFGMLTEGEEDIVRDPIRVNVRGELVCVGEIPENAVLNILKGKDASLLQAAENAATECLRNLGSVTVRENLVFDCISRSLFLKNFSKELKLIQKRITSKLPGNSPVGALTLGEISSYGQKYLEFFNKTVVIGTLYE
ncbi:MAG: FIST C-terminal domain-containing protein [Nitrospirae bacterium]|nr:FIST C-terminal domain-containing protein [Nitrospirota bacterium]